ncbi:MAG TPA: PTS sugar transporter subunit IIA [Candidatus Nesterenkonia stercoripullorum]|uniref:Ascorbate-specific PTS system EIIA component n=1 Tax=Candidatus Nesterenkonia stercoripullorum TaxID=2838701 RepID=A0A9D2A986_9MICC|nr:PTS sugar transporter subunit IIA [Candidatus Nesterenkonia stercoripullorum]
MSSSIDSLIGADSILLGAEAADWASAIRIAGGMLESSGATTHEYTQAMIDSVVEHGPYIVIAPGFAFAHARPSEAVKTTAMSWLRLAEPVEFGHEKNDPVQLVVALAAVDSQAHTKAMADLARLLGNAQKRAALDEAESPAQIRAILRGEDPEGAGDEVSHGAVSRGAGSSTGHSAVSDEHLILTVCGNGLGTSLFLKNTLESVLGTWGWERHVSVEATDTISARGRAKEAQAILTSGEIARTLGDVGVPVRVVENFTSTDELDAALRELYDV